MYNKILRAHSFLAPDTIGNKPEALCGKEAPESGGCVRSLQCRFNKQRSAAAERVEHKRIGVYPRKIAHCGAQRFLERCVIRFSSVAALMQSLARGINHKRSDILINKETNAVFRAGLLKMRYMIFLLESFDNSLFNYRLAVRYAEECGINTPAVYGKRVVFSDIILPRQRLNAVKKLCEGRGPEFAHIYHNSLCIS